MKKIERYIQFAIDNGYEFFLASYVRDIEYKEKVIFWRNFPQYWTIKIYLLDDCDVPKEKKVTNENYCNLITSKPFIEAVARGIWEKSEWRNKESEKIFISVMSDNITTDQAIAIRENKLEEFINNLLPKEQWKTHKE